MVVRVRLARHGTRNNPFYHIVAIQDKAARNARPIEKLGEYDPIPRARIDHEAASTVGMGSASTSARPHVYGPILSSGLEEMQEGIKLEKRIEWNVERIQHWLNVGAQPTKPVARLLDRAGLIPEGKFFKGMYRPEGADKAKAGAKAAGKSGTGAPASVILEAAGVSKEKQASAKEDAAAAVALPQGEGGERNARRTDPKAEAVKTQKGQGSIDQAA